jgi:hypothetical protein
MKTGDNMTDKSIAQKLFIKPGFKFLLVNPPDGYLSQMGELPEGTLLLSDSSCQVDAIQVFVANRTEVEAQLPQLKELLAPKGMMWITYHKGTSKVKTDINRDTIYAYAHTIGLDGVGMVSIDDNWSAMRLKLTRED